MGYETISSYVLKLKYFYLYENIFKNTYFQTLYCDYYIIYRYVFIITMQFTHL